MTAKCTCSWGYLLFWKELYTIDLFLLLFKFGVPSHVPMQSVCLIYFGEDMPGCENEYERIEKEMNEVGTSYAQCKVPL